MLTECALLTHMPLQLSCAARGFMKVNVALESGKQYIFHARKSEFAPSTPRKNLAFVLIHVKRTTVFKFYAFF